MEEKKRYTFCHLANGKNYKGEDCIVATFDGPIFKPEVKTVNDKKIVNGRLPINNQTARLKKFLGDDIVEKDGIVWVDVTAWSAVADRLEKCVKDSKVFCSIITGTLTKSVDDNDKGKFVNVRMVIEDFKLSPMSKSENAEGSEPGEKAPASNTSKSNNNKAPEPAKASQPEESANMSDDDEDDDLPF